MSVGKKQKIREKKGDTWEGEGEEAARHGRRWWQWRWRWEERSTGGGGAVGEYSRKKVMV